MLDVISISTPTPEGTRLRLSTHSCTGNPGVTDRLQEGTNHMLWQDPTSLLYVLLDIANKDNEVEVGITVSGST